MIYLKSLFAGLAATIMALFLVCIIAIAAIYAINYRQLSGGTWTIGWDPVSFARSGLGWIVLSAAFLTGFWWEYRRLVVR